MQLRSWKTGTVAFAFMLAALSTGCDNGSSVARKDASPDVPDARAQADSAGDSGRSDASATADSSTQAPDSPRAVDSGNGANDSGSDAVLAVDTPASDLPPNADVPQAISDANAELAPDVTAPDAPSAKDAPTVEATPDADRADAPLDASHADDATIKHDGIVITIDAGTDTGAPAPFELAVAPNRMLDLVFLIDNSPSMALKQQKLKAQFPKLIDGLRDPSDGTLPDLRVAIIDSDLGTGGEYSAGSCGPKTLPDGSISNYGDLGRFQMVGAQACGVTTAGSLWLEYKQGQPVNYTGDISTVFSCLATNLGTLGCGEEHTLQAFEFALAANGIGNDAQQAMLRPSAYLGLVFLSDEDDCSAATNDAIFGTTPGGTTLLTESASLRCATRAHACGGVNLSDASPPGYPTTASFSTSLANCAARTDACPNAIDGETAIDVSVPTACSPLRSVGRMATKLKALKSRAEQVFVAGIFGWPMSDADMATATYKIAPVPNPMTGDTAHPTVFDAWPVCYDPNHLPQSPDPTTGFDTTAAYYGGTSGLRLSAFVDAFGDNGMKFSICQPDYAAAMTKIAGALSKKMQNLCLPAVYAQLACSARYLRPDSNGALVSDPTTVPACNAQKSNAPCYALGTNESICPAGEYVVTPIQAGDAGVESLPYGTMLEFRCP